MKKTKVYDYDVYYKFNSYMVMAVAATSAKEAKRTAIRQLMEEMSKEEIINRFIAALDVDPEFSILSTERIEESTDSYTEEEIQEIIKKEQEEY